MSEVHLDRDEVLHAHGVLVGLTNLINATVTYLGAEEDGTPGEVEASRALYDAADALSSDSTTAYTSLVLLANLLVNVTGEADNPAVQAWFTERQDDLRARLRQTDEE